MFRLSGKFDFYLSIAHDKGLCALVKRCKLNRNTHNKLSSKVIFEVDMPRAAQAYHDAVSDRNRLYRLEFFRNLGIGALLLAVLALSLFLKKEID